MSPKRIQQRRTKGWRMPPGAKSVARPSGWGNPFRVGHELRVETYSTDAANGFGCTMPITPQLAVDLYRAWSICRPENVDEIREDLAGFDLACWCPLGTPCHADVLLWIANSEGALS